MWTRTPPAVKRLLTHTLIMKYSHQSESTGPFNNALTHAQINSFLFYIPFVFRFVFFVYSSLNPLPSNHKQFSFSAWRLVFYCCYHSFFLYCCWNCHCMYKGWNLLSAKKANQNSCFNWNCFYMGDTKVFFFFFIPGDCRFAVAFTEKLKEEAELFLVWLLYFGFHYTNCINLYQISIDVCKCKSVSHMAYHLSFEFMAP